MHRRLQRVRAGRTVRRFARGEGAGRKSEVEMTKAAEALGMKKADSRRPPGSPKARSREAGGVPLPDLARVVVSPHPNPLLDEERESRTRVRGKSSPADSLPGPARVLVSPHPNPLLDEERESRTRVRGKSSPAESLPVELAQTALCKDAVPTRDLGSDAGAREFRRERDLLLTGVVSHLTMKRRRVDQQARATLGLPFAQPGYAVWPGLRADERVGVCRS
jgi:hypothetical protein